MNLTLLHLPVFEYLGQNISLFFVTLGSIAFTAFNKLIRYKVLWVVIQNVLQIFNFIIILECTLQWFVKWTWWTHPILNMTHLIGREFLDRIRGWFPITFFGMDISPILSFLIWDWCLREFGLYVQRMPSNDILL